MCRAYYNDFLSAFCSRLSTSSASHASAASVSASGCASASSWCTSSSVAEATYNTLALSFISNRKRDRMHTSTTTSSTAITTSSASRKTTTSSPIATTATSSGCEGHCYGSSVLLRVVFGAVVEIPSSSSFGGKVRGLGLVWKVCRISAHCQDRRNSISRTSAKRHLNLEPRQRGHRTTIGKMVSTIKYHNPLSQHCSLRFFPSNPHLPHHPIQTRTTNHSFSPTRSATQPHTSNQLNPHAPAAPTYAPPSKTHARPHKRSTGGNFNAPSPSSRMSYNTRKRCR